jgi:hypothetical protein
MSMALASVNTSSELNKIERAKIARRKWREKNRDWEVNYQLNLYHSRYKTDDNYRNCRRFREKLRYYNLTINNLQNKDVLNSRDKKRLDNLIALRDILLSSHSQYLEANSEKKSD